jgi:hypothetical protein
MSLTSQALQALILWKSRLSETTQECSKSNWRNGQVYITVCNMTTASRSQRSSTCRVTAATRWPRCRIVDSHVTMRTNTS